LEVAEFPGIYDIDDWALTARGIYLTLPSECVSLNRLVLGMNPL
jgi:hypothetical protein